MRRTSHTVDPKCMAVLCSVMIWHVVRVWYMWLVFWGYLTKLSGLRLWFNVFQVLQETVARQRRDRTAPHVLCVMT